ncbi:MAG: DNA repair protein RecO [Flavobacteriaceae bacterium]|nr:DNA repair protein RecO [Flavobacteriaceae bacterium]
MLLTTKAIVFSAIKYGEADLIVSCFTEESGIRSYLLKNILRSKRGKLKRALFLPLTQLEIVAFHKTNGTLGRIREAKVEFHYQSLHSDIIKLSLVLFLAEVLKKSIREEEENKPLYRFISQSFLWLDQHDNCANFHLLFLLKLTHYLGFYPNTVNEDAPFFNLEEGCFQNNDLDNTCVSGENIVLLKTFLGINFDTLEQTKLSKKTRLAFLDLLLSYYKLHLQGFKNPESLSVLNQLFN